MVRQVRCVKDMDIRITKTLDGESTLLRVDGRLVQENLSLLKAECRSSEGSLVLDLGGVTYADSVGADFLRDLMESGARLNAVTHFVEMLLKDVASDKAHQPRPDT